MAGHGYVTRDDWNNGNGHSDHVCRPVIVDAEGRKKPIICYTANHNTEIHATKRETIFEHVYVPENKYSSPPTQGVNNYSWRRASTAINDRPPEVEEFITNVQTEVSRPTRTGPISAWPRNTPNSTGHGGTTGYGDYGNFNNGNWNNPSVGTRLGEIPDGNNRTNDNLIEPTTAVDFRKEPVKSSSITTAAPKPRFTTPFSTVPKRNNDIEPIESKDRNKPSGGNRRDEYPDGYYRANDNLTEPTTAVDKSSSITAAAPQPRFATPLPTVPKRDTYTETTDNRDWNKPSAGNRREENPDGNYRRSDSMTGPTPINKSSSERPRWTTPLSQPITKLTNDIGEAVDFLKESAKSSSITAPAPQPRVTAPITTGLKKDTYTETIDSREASRRYARPFPFKTEETFTGTIDSREAMKKYNGSIVPL